MKIATKLNANILQGVGLVVLAASIFQPRNSPLENLLYGFGLTLMWAGLTIDFYIRGYEKGHREARLIITEEVSARRAAEWTKRVWAEQAVPSEHEPFEAKTFREGADK